MTTVGAAALGAAAAFYEQAQTGTPAPTPTPRVRESGPRVLQFMRGGGSWIGVSVRDVEESDATAEKPTTSGVLVDEVTPQSPAEAAGLKPRDIVVEFDGERVRSTRQFTRLVQETPAGRKTAAIVLRGGARVPLTIVPSESSGARFFGEFDGMPDIAGRWMGRVPPAPPAPPVPPAPPAASVPPAPPAPPAPPRGFFEFEDFSRRGASGRLGISVSELQPQLAEYFGTKDGVLVTSVSDNSVASGAGIKAGDVITSVNGKDVMSASELRQRIAEVKDGEEFSIGVVRDRKATTLKGKAETGSVRRRTVL
jgi:serine protease Do